MYQPHRYAMQPQLARGGFTDVLKKVAGVAVSALPGPVGTIVRAGANIISPSRASVPAPTAIPNPVDTSTSFTGIRTPLVSIGRETTMRQSIYAQGVSVGTPTGADGCPKGYHRNRTGYFTKGDGYVAPGTKCVRNRTRNIANGRALRRAISRASGFDKLVKRNRKALRSLAKI